MRSGIYEAWCMPGCPEEQGTITAAEAKPIGATNIIASSFRKFRIWHDERSFDNRGCWRIDERIVVGTTHPAETWESLADGDEYSSLREAKAVARRLARGAR
jgi:hypothetical protein